MTLTATERQFLHIAKAAVSGGELPAENVDWPAVFTLAGQQKLLPIVFEAARKTPAAAENAALFAAVKQHPPQAPHKAELRPRYQGAQLPGLRYHDRKFDAASIIESLIQDTRIHIFDYPHHIIHCGR